MGPTIAIVVLIVLVLLIVVRNIYVVQQSKAYVIERLGAFHSVWGVGLHLKVPFIERVVKKVSLKEQVADFDPQPVITKDNVTMSIDSVVFFRIMDPKLYTYGVESPILAIENLSATTLRNIIGDLDLDTTLTSRDTINAKMRAILDEATDAWGIKVNRVEVKNITPPSAIQQAMEKQMKAEREKREAVLLAEGEKQAAITIAEGNKQAQILSAEAAKQQVILAAEAEKEKQIREAEGEAEAIKNVQQATADGIRMVREAGADNAVLTLQAFEALKERFLGALNADLNTSLAVTAVYDVLKAKTNDATKLAALASFDEVLGLNLLSAAEKARSAQPEEEHDPEIDALVAARTEAKRAKNWPEADRIRDELKARGIEVIDTPQGAKWKRI